MSSFSRGCLRIILLRYCSELFLGFGRLQRQRVRDHFLWFWSHASLLEKFAHCYWLQYLGHCLYSKWENVSLNDFEIDSLALQKGRSTNQHPYTKPSKCEQWREERCGQTLQGMWMSMKPRTMLQDQMWMNMKQAKINDYAARYQKWNTQHGSLHIQLYDHNPQPCTCDWR